MIVVKTVLIALMALITIDIPPFLPKQEQFIFSKDRYICYSGGVGSGKTYAGCHKGLYLSLKYLGNRGLIGTQTYTQLKDTTQRTFFEDVCPKELIHDYLKSEQRLVLVNGSEIIFRTLDDETKLRSLNLGWFYIDEITTVHERIFKQLKYRLRFPKVPERYGFGTTNPDSPRHWAYQHFAKGKTKDARLIETSSFENRYLSADYVTDLKYTTDADDYRRLVLGQWIAHEGIIYKEFSRDRNVLPPDWQPNLSQWAKFRAIDWGYINPFVCLFIAVDGDGVVYVFDEYYRRERLLEDHAKEIKQRYPNVYFHKTYYDPSDAESPHKLRRLGFEGLRAGRNDVVPGIQAVKAFISGKGGKTRLLVHPRCMNLIDEFESYRWDEARSGDLKEQPVKENDHGLDSLRYFLYTDFRREL